MNKFKVMVGALVMLILESPSSISAELKPCPSCHAPGVVCEPLQSSFNHSLGERVTTLLAAPLLEEFDICAGTVASVACFAYFTKTWGSDSYNAKNRWLVWGAFFSGHAILYLSKMTNPYVRYVAYAFSTMVCIDRIIRNSIFPA